MVAAAAGGIAGAIAVLGFGHAVRYEASAIGERYGATVSVERVVPGLRGVKLRGIDVSVAEVPSARVHLDEVEVAYGWSGRQVTLRGGMVSAVGPREEVMRQ